MNESDYSALAESAGLYRVGARPSLGTYIKQVWERRDFAITFARYRIESANERNRLGLAWVVIRPLLNAIIYGLVFGFVLGTSKGIGYNFIAYLIVGVFIFEFFSDSFGDGAKSVTSNSQLVKSLSFPRILLPIASVLQSLFELIPMVFVMFVIVWIVGEPPHLSWLLVIPILAVMTLFNAGVAFIAARLTTHFRDFSQIVPFISRIMFYTTGIFFSLDQYLLKIQPGGEELLFIARLNPVHDFIALVRSVVIEGFPFEPMYWIVAVVGALVFFVGGFIYFWWAEEEYGRD